ncbi:MAG TPA: hypothetical protein VIM36_10685 [Gemmatimonadaceae bacterium]
MHLATMGYYEESPPRHGHRTPSELAEDEMLSALHGDFCGMPETLEQPRPRSDTECVPLPHVALLPWADAHPLPPTSVRQTSAGKGEGRARINKAKEKSEP